MVVRLITRSPFSLRGRKIRLDATGEIDLDLFEKTSKFVVYTHLRPDGSPFYVGKGVRSRAFCFAKSRRTKWHTNIVDKYGRENIGVVTIACEHERMAFFLETAMIKNMRDSGESLANITDGGEGASGRKMTDAQAKGFEKGRRVGKKGTKGPRPQFEAWIKSAEGIAHNKKLGQLGAIRLHVEVTKTCAMCGKEFITRTAKAKCCSELCGQRHYRANGPWQKGKKL